MERREVARSVKVLADSGKKKGGKKGRSLVRLNGCHPVRLFLPGPDFDVIKLCRPLSRRGNLE